MDEIIQTMSQVFKENPNKAITADHAIDYYLKNKQLPFGSKATEKQLRDAILLLHKNGTIKQSISKTGTYSKVIFYIYEVVIPNQQMSFI